MMGSARQSPDMSGDRDFESGEPPSKRPRVLSKACEICKMKKSRCDSGRPQCDACRRKGLNCVYREKGQPGLRPGYGKAIEQRLTLLENNMDKINQSIQDVLNYVRTESVNKSSAPMADDSLGDSSLDTIDKASHSAGDVLSPIHRDMVATAPLPPANNIISADRTVEEPQIWSVSQQLPEVSSLTSTPADTMTNQLRPSHALNPVASGLPPQEIMDELVELFFDLVYPWAPLFFKPSFTANMYTSERQILLHGIAIVAFRFWRKPDPPLETREAYVKASRDFILLKTIDTCTLISTQALTLLAIDTIGQGQGPRTWNVMSMLVTAAKHLGLSKNPSSSTIETNTPLVRNEDPDDGLDSSIIEMEERRRLFWVIYSIDRLSSVSHGQPGGTDTRNIRLPYPVNDEDWGQSVPPEWFQAMGAIKQSQGYSAFNLWRHYIDLLALLDRSNQLLIQPVNYSLPAHCQEWQSSFRRLDINLATWFENLPREVREPPPDFNPMWILVHATFHLINIRMYTVAAFPSTSSPYLRPSPSARARCRQAVRDIASLASSVPLQKLEQLGPLFAFVVWVAARSLIILWTTGHENTYGSMPTDLEPLLSSLRQLSIPWPCSQRYINLIQLILDTKNNPGGPTGLEIFNDTRRTAYGLQNRLSTLADPQVPEFDFLDMPLLDMNEMSAPWSSTFVADVDGEWL
ncbi:fungal-specific transcription factor domain-containing protein [Trichoderma sp. SZMC 28015]